MSDHRTRTGARLRSHSRVIARGVAQMTEADYVQPKCKRCGKAVNDDRCEHGNFDGACSKSCATAIALEKRTGKVSCGRGHQERASRWSAEYASARAAKGEWIDIHFGDSEAAKQFTRTVNAKRDFEAVRDVSIVSIRLVAA